MRILFVGDIFGKPGRDIAKRAIPALIQRDGIDFVIANVENAAAGFGITGEIAEGILGYGVDVMTTGNHVWDKKEILDYIPRQPKLLRPANFPSGAPGRGSCIGRTRTGEPVGVLNLMGRIFMLTNRPVIVPGASDVRVEPLMDGANEEVFVTFDGQSGHALQADDVIEIRRAERPLRLVRARKRTYFELLRQKLKWGER